MINMNATMFGVHHQMLDSLGLGEAAHQPEPDDGFTEWDNDVSHLLSIDTDIAHLERPARPTGAARSAAIASLFSRVAARAPDSARYQQVAVSTVSSLATLYCNMASTRGDLGRPPRERTGSQLLPTVRRPLA